MILQGKACFKKRKAGLMKKANELCTPCRVNGCAIVFSPYNPQPNVWPLESGAQCVLGRFRDIPELEQNRRTMNQETFTMQMLTKVKEQVVKQHKENRHKEMTVVMVPCLNVEKIQNLSLAYLNEMGCLAGQNIRDVERSIEYLNREWNEERKEWIGWEWNLQLFKICFTFTMVEPYFHLPL